MNKTNRYPGEEIIFESLPTGNFRELGGYETKDGRHVKRGIFYRGPALFGLSEEDCRKIEAMNIKCILDLRSRGEAAMLPDWIPKNTSYERISGMSTMDGVEMDFSPASIEKALKELSKVEEIRNPAQFMIRLYCGMAFGNEALRRLFELLKEECVPVFFHCTAGKDRTGVAAALILIALGVEPERAIEDYLLTNKYRQSFIESKIAERKEYYAAHKEEELMLRGAYGVNRIFMDELFRVILEKYGNFERYFEAEYGLGSAEIERLRNVYLE